MLQFNCPYQLGTHEFSSVPTSDAKVYDVPVEKDDVIVLCSDGLVDNLVSLLRLGDPPFCPRETSLISVPFPYFERQFDEEMLEEIKAFSGSSSTPRSPQRISEALCSRAKDMSERRKDKGPFGEKAKVSGLNHVGGKRDGQSPSRPLLGRVSSFRTDEIPSSFLLRISDISVIVAIVGDPTHS